MNTTQKAIDVYHSQGIVPLIHAAWKSLFKRLEANSPQKIHKFIVQLYWLPYLTILRREQVGYKLQKIASNESFYFPHLQHHWRNRTRSLERKRDLYFGFDEVPMEDNDIVLDVGAFIGEASILISEQASEIYAIEPSSRSFKCLEKNVERFDNIRPINHAVWNKKQTIELKLGTDPTDDSILDPDYQEEEQIESVQANTVRNICNKFNIDTVDFLKIEAEGAEPEVLEGLGSLRPQKIAVNCDPERNGQSTKIEVIEELSNLGYEVFEQKDQYYTIVYGKLEIK